MTRIGSCERELGEVSMNLDRGPEVATGLPEGEPLDEATMPRLGTQHVKRLRFIWSHGRPVHLQALSGVDLDLQVHGFLQPVVSATGGCATVTITRLGVLHLNEARQATIATQKPHHLLGQRLALYLQAKGMWTWENVEFSNPAPAGSGRTWGVVRPDVFACLPTLRAASSRPTIYEVKVSRSDFMADMARPEKHLAYLDLAQCVYYCCPEGLIKPKELPPTVGLLYERLPGDFVVQQRAKRKKGFSLAADTVMTLVVKPRQSSTL